MENKVIGKQVRNLVDDYFDYKDKCFEEISKAAVKRGYLEREFYNEVSMYSFSNEELFLLLKKFKENERNNSDSKRKNNLNQSDREYLAYMGLEEDEIEQLNDAVCLTDYTYCDSEGRKIKISAKKAREILGDKDYLNGLFRSCSHHDAIRYTDAKDSCVYFDSDRFYKFN